jgi:hypothetical protein
LSVIKLDFHLGNAKEREANLVATSTRQRHLGIIHLAHTPLNAPPSMNVILSYSSLFYRSKESNVFGLGVNFESEASTSSARREHTTYRGHVEGGFVEVRRIHNCLPGYIREDFGLCVLGKTASRSFALIDP